MINRPASLRIFIAVFTVTALAFLISIPFSHYRVDRKYSMIIAFLMFIALSFTTVGIYTGYNFQTTDKKSIVQNKIGLWGNSLIFILVITLMLLAALTTANK